MDSETVLAQARVILSKATEPTAAVAKAAPEMHHFTSHGRGNPRDTGAFASAKVLLEGAIAAAERGAVNDVLKPSPGQRRYVVGLMGSGPTAWSKVETKLDAVTPLLGTMSIRQLRPSEHGEFSDTDRVQTGCVFELRLAQEPSGDMPIALRSKDLRMLGTFDFTVVNGNVAHCDWMPSLRATRCRETVRSSMSWARRIALALRHD